MMASIVGRNIERCLLPSPDIVSWDRGEVKQISLTTCQKIRHFIGNIFLLIVNIVCLPFAVVYSLTKALITRTISLFSSPKKGVPNGPVDSAAAALPKHFGFADSLFQTSGLGTKASATPFPGLSNWDKWLNPRRIEGTTEGEYRKFFIDVLRNPEPFIQILREMKVTAHRFSLEWSVIEPQKGRYDLEAIQLYRNFIQRLKESGIEPYVTLHHFVCPEWFEQMGGFDKLENIAIFKEHVLKMMELFPNVVNWMPFNEINVDAFQKCVRGVYPPGREGDIAGAGKMMRNMLLAHCQIYKAAKEKRPHLQIGSTHQWLKFEPLEGNPLEEAICYFLSKITHYACYNFFKTGQFSLEIPGKANVQFSMPQGEFKKYNGFSDFIGVQFYGFPRLKAGFNGGHKFPGYKVTNLNFWKLGLTFGSTCPKGGEVMSFSPGFYPESLEKCLTEAVALKKPIVISETGCDAKTQKWGEKEFKVHDETQKRYFERIFPILQKFKDHLKAFFTWTVVRRHLEWDRGDFPLLGTVDILKDQNRNIVGHVLSPAALFLQNVYRDKKEELAKEVPALQVV